MKKKNFLKDFLIWSFIFVLVFGFLANNTKISRAETKEEEKIRLEAELEELKKQIAEQEKIISTTQEKSASLSRDITYLQSQINKKQLEIKQIDNNLTTLSNQISDKNSELKELDNNLVKKKEVLAKAMRDINSFDGINSLLAILLDNKTISEFFEEVDRVVFLQEAINKNLDEIRGISNKVLEVKNSLEEDKDTQLILKDQQKSEQRKIDAAKTETNSLLKKTENDEKEYKRQLAAYEARAAEIRAALFPFTAAAGANPIPFGDALKFAERAEARTGTPAALVLAILKQESALGANVGKCYLSDTVSGKSYNVDSKKEYDNGIKASRDIPGFLEITKRLGLDPLATVVSCPLSIGYGGAMGPAQFIPSTWIDIEKGAGVSNPWNPEEAIMASSYYLSRLGADNTYAGQIRAACKYYGEGGTNCSYGQSVMRYVDQMQSDIDYLKLYGG